MGLLGAIGGALGSFFGPIGTGIGSALGGALDSDAEQDRAEGYSSAQAQANRDFQERMSNTSYQRGMEDMRKAGLNPMLAYSQGGATVPQGSMASYPGPVGASYQAAAASATSANAAVMQAETARKIGDETVHKIKQEVRNLKTDQDRLDAVILNLGEERQNLIKQGWNMTEIGNHIRAQIDKIRTEIPVINSQGFLNAAGTRLKELEAALAGYDVQAASKFNNLGRDARQLAPLVDILKLFIGRGRVSGN